MAADGNWAWKLVYLAVVVAAISASSARVDAALSCSTVISDILPCVSYVAGNAAQPSQGCCNGVKSLNSATQTTADRRAACNCIKSAASSYNANYDKVGKLPGLCGVKLGFTITPSLNCATIP